MSKRGVDISTEESRDGRRFRVFSEGPIEDLGPVDARRDEIPHEQVTAERAADPFQVSADMRAMAEKSVERARRPSRLSRRHRAVDMFGETSGRVPDVAERDTFAKGQALSFRVCTQPRAARDVQDCFGCRMVRHRRASFLRACPTFR